MVVGKSWADEVEEEMEEAEKHQELEQSKPTPPPPPPTARHEPNPVSHHTTADASDSWRRKDTRPSPAVPSGSNTTPRDRQAPFQPRTILSHTAPPVHPKTSPPHGASDLGHPPASALDQGRPTSSSGAASAPGPVSNSSGPAAGVQGLPPALQEAVTQACQDIIHPYCKAMVQILHQLTTTIPIQLPKAVAAACSSAAGGQHINISAADLQKALLISLAPLQEQVAQIQKTLAHVVPAHLPQSSPAPHTQHHNGGASPGRVRNAQPPPPTAQSNPPVRRPSPTSAPSSARTSSPAPIINANTAGMSFAERMKAAADEKKAAERVADTSTPMGPASGTEEEDDYAHKPTTTKHHKVKTGYQAYQPPVRRTE